MSISTLPTGVALDVLCEPTRIAEDVADAASRVARDVAALGTSDEPPELLAQRIWANTELQLNEIRRLYGLPNPGYVFPLATDGD